MGIACMGFGADRSLRGFCSYGGLSMPDKPPMEDSRRMWDRVLSSIPHGVKIRTIAVRPGGEEEAKALPDAIHPPPEPPTPGPFGPE